LVARSRRSGQNTTTNSTQPAALSLPTRDCQLSPWGNWSSCSRSCGTGVKSRNRFVLKAALPGGTCGPLEDTVTCKTQPCPVDCKLGKPGDWSECSKVRLLMSLTLLNVIR
jgi:hypothetical protein